MLGYVKNVWDGTLIVRDALGTNWARVLRPASAVALILVALWLYAKVNRYEYLVTREYTDGEYSLLRYDRIRGRLEECVVPGIDGRFRDPREDQATCLAFRASSTPADRR